MVDGNGLENRRGATHREFESRPLRQEKEVISKGYGLFLLLKKGDLNDRVRAQRSRLVREPSRPLRKEKRLKGIFLSE